MKQRAALVAAVVTVLGMFAAPAAHASCTEVIDGTGCVENVVCGAADAVLGDKVNCVH